MKRTPLTTIVALLALVLLLQQVSFGQKNTKSVHNNEVVENFKKLDFNWSLSAGHELEMTSGIELLKNGEWKSALKFFDKVIEFDSSFIPAYYFRYSCYEVGDKIPSEEALNNRKYLYKKIHNSSEHIYGDLWDIYASGKRQTWISSSTAEIPPPWLRLSQYLVEHRYEVRGETFDYLKRAFSLLVIAKQNEAIDLCNKSLESESSSCALYIKAIAFQMLPRHDSAYHVFNELVKKDEQIPEAHANLALYKYWMKDKIGTIKHLTALSTIASVSPEIWRFSGMLKMQILDYDGSILDLTKYLNTDSTDFDCLKQRAIAKYNVKDYTGSLRDLNSALKVNESDLNIHFYKSENYLHMGDSIRAIKVLKDAVRIFSFDHDLDLFTANKLVEVNKPRQAQVIIDRVKRVVTPNHFSEKYLHQANLIQCKIYLRKGLTDKALDKLNSLIGKEGEYVDYLFLRAEIYLKKGDKERAKADLTKLVKEGFQPAIELYKSL